MKYIRRFKVSSDYEAFKNSDDYITPNIVYINENSNLYLQPYVNNGEESGGNLIIFYIADSIGIRPNFTEYTAIEGMTWGEWVDSEYNTSDLHIVEMDEMLYILTSNNLSITNSVGSSVRPSDIIINGEKYLRG